MRREEDDPHPHRGEDAMYFHHPIDQVTKEDLQQLEQSGTMESRQLEFKAILPEKIAGDGKREFLKDITAFANADGGTLLYGVHETEEGTAEIKGIEHSDPDALKRQLSAIIQENTEPRLQGVLIHFIPLEDGRYVLGIDVPKSWNAPHAVRINKGTYRFHVRSNTDNIAMDALQIKDHILANANLREKIRDFLANRLLNLANGETPSPIYHSSKIILHLIPVTAFQKDKQIDISRMYRGGIYSFPLYERAVNHRLNLDGYLSYRDDPERRHGSYLQVYRNGIIETVETKLVNRILNQEKRAIPSRTLVSELISALNQYIALYEANHIRGPIYGFITLQDIKGNCLPSHDQIFGSFGPPFDRHTIQLPEMVIEDLDTPAEELLKVPMDALWNAGGFSECPYI
jgi:Putative DNA-binding domain